LQWLGDAFVKDDGSTVDQSQVTDGKIVIVLYSASW
jgi:hypothetical protein